MMNKSIVIPTSENTKSSPVLVPVLASAIACCIVVAPSFNYTKLEFPKQFLSNVHIVSTDNAKSEVYNSGNIKLCLDGVSAMNTDLLHSYQKIAEIGCLEENWNDNGASKFSIEILDSIRSIVKNLVRQPSIFPTARESIQLEYENDTGDYLEFELFESGRLKKFYCSHSGESTTEDIPIEMIYEVVEKFYESKV